MLMLPAMLVVGCVVPSDSSATLIKPDDLPDQLRTDVTSTTTLLIESAITMPMTIYVIAPLGERTVVVPAQRAIRPSANLFDRLSIMFVNDLLTPEEAEVEYQNALASLELRRAEVTDGGIAVIDIVSTDVDGKVIALDNDALRDAVAQLVYTATSFDNINAVRLLYDGKRVILPTQGQEGDTDRVITTADYPLYDPDTVIRALVTTTTTVSPTPSYPVVTTRSDDNSSTSTN